MDWLVARPTRNPIRGSKLDMTGKMRWPWLMTAAMTLLGTTLSGACRRGAGSDEPRRSDPMNAAEAGSKCKVSIASWALEGCRAPNEPGCETCYVSNPNGTCTVLSGHARDGDRW